MWHQLDFQLSEQAEKSLFKGQRRSETAFRKVLAALNTQYAIGLPSGFFGYGADGQHDPQVDITIGMGYTPSGLRLVATGSEASALLVNRAGAINAALMHAAQALIPMSSRGGEHNIQFLPMHKRYFIANMGVGKQTKDSFWLRAVESVKAGSTWMEVADKRLATTISRGILRQAVALATAGDDLEGNVGALLAKPITEGMHRNAAALEFGNRLDVQIHSIGTHTFLKLDEQRTRLVLRNIEFTMRGDLDGPWFVGRLKIQAQGQIVPSSRAWAQEAQAA